MQMQAQNCEQYHLRKEPEEIIRDFTRRKQGILRALTTDCNDFFAACRPDQDNLCLYGNTDGSWTCGLPCDEVPPELPEPALGINFARDGMLRTEFFSLVAAHSDAWLISVAFYQGAKLNREGRAALFNAVNDDPPAYELVSEYHGLHARNARGLGSEAGEDSAPEAEGAGEQCPNCGRPYRNGDFWIACDFCDTWYDGLCVGMTQQMAQKVGKWRCPVCTKKATQP